MTLSAADGVAYDPVIVVLTKINYPTGMRTMTGKWVYGLNLSFNLGLGL